MNRRNDGEMLNFSGFWRVFDLFIQFRTIKFVSFQINFVFLFSLENSVTYHQICGFEGLLF